MGSAQELSSAEELEDSEIREEDQFHKQPDAPELSKLLEEHAHLCRERG